MKPFLPLIFFVILGACVAPSTESVVQVKDNCDITDLSIPFSDIKPTLGKTFCGYVTALVDSRTLKVFPYRAVPGDRRDTVAFFDDKTDLFVRSKVDLERSSADLYIEAIIEGEQHCYESTAPNACAPYRNPIFLKVRRIEFPSP